MVTLLDDTLFEMINNNLNSFSKHKEELPKTYGTINKFY